MKNFKILLTTIVIFSLAACSKNTTGNRTACKGAANLSCVCTQQYDPVCGCDGKTYGNECEAKCAGLTSWTKGKCP